MQERPNTIAGLAAKHAELTKLRAQYEAEIERITVDLNHLDATMRLFESDPIADQPAANLTTHKEKKGSMTRFVLARLREADEPLTSRQIMEMWCADQKLVADDATYPALRKRIGECIKSCESRGLVEHCGWTTQHGRSEPYKLWEKVKAGP